MATDENASADEIITAIRALSGPDHKRLAMIARCWYHWRGEPFRGIAGPDDLMQEALMRTLDGRRRWRKAKVTLIRHLDQTMRSISGHMVAEAEGEREELATLAKQTLPTSESQVLARERIAGIGKMFSDDTIALDVLRCRAMGKNADEIRSELSLNKTEYATICRRIVRKFAITP